MRCAYCDYCEARITEKNIRNAVKMDGLRFCSDDCLQDYIDQYAEEMHVYDLTEYGDEEEEEK